jgi:hypothetical protein
VQRRRQLGLVGLRPLDRIAADAQHHARRLGTMPNVGPPTSAG